VRVGVASSRGRLSAALEILLNSSVKHQLVGLADDAASALALCKNESLHVLLLDVGLAGGGPELVRRIKAESGCAVLVMSRSDRDLSGVYAAMDAGALDVVPLPGDGPLSQVDSVMVLAKLRTVSRLVGVADSKPTPDSPHCSLVAIGASTGGPQAVANVIRHLPSDSRLCVVVVQHVDTEFADGLARWIQTQTPLSAELVTPASRPRPGHVLLAASNDHLVMTRARAFAYTPEPARLAYRPSVDVFFTSLAQYWPPPATAILLTGMGRDGAQGLLKLRQAGWHTIAQDEKSSVVFGMPKAAIELGAATRVLPLDEIGKAVAERAGRVPR
jgi:two-component system, chemotaxis family, response regulator WspF